MFNSELFTLQLRIAQLMAETQTVMALRLLAMSGAIPAKRGENERMVEEKGVAMASAFAAGVTEMMKGRRPDQIMSAAMAPISRKVSSNRKRLMK
ncbi:antifreeze protein [Sulfitobacter sp. F26204]|uniref:antifreeze protein n=1 Tax=Sulfitobacter sp. F26204 TaxID=2996014 RepID=UPI00225DE33F|nr:antifreeze protein [Sulfitobacter sp. F26204]MCX7560379.1 antifreeze protein [Sulfitobacter sp. F26204]